MPPGFCGVEPKTVACFQIDDGGSFPPSWDSEPTILGGKKAFERVSKTGKPQHGKLMAELKKWFCSIDCSENKLISWPAEVELKWKSLNVRKSERDIGVLTWNVNGRLNFRGCRESLLRRWVLGGSVDIVLIQEHFKASSATSINCLSQDWWCISSDTVGGGTGRKSGGCATLVQPCLVTDGGFTHPGGRICGIFLEEGLIVTIYFPTMSPGQSREDYVKTFTTFIDQLILVIEDKIRRHPVRWIVCGTDTNAHFKGTGCPPRRSDDSAAKQVRRFMKRFNLVSLSEKICPTQFTYLNSRGGSSCPDTFLVSEWLYNQNCVIMHEIIDFMEHGSDHCPVYVRLRVHPKWSGKARPITRRILKTSGLKSLYRKMSSLSSRRNIVNIIKSQFSSVDWASASSREDMNSRWLEWVKLYDSLVEKLIGTRRATQSTWGRKFDNCIRAFCKKASISRSWFLKAKLAGCQTNNLYVRWRDDRRKFISAWEESERAWVSEKIQRAINLGGIAIWKLLGGRWKDSTRSLVVEDGLIITEPGLIVEELVSHHEVSLKENTEIPAGDFVPVQWENTFEMDSQNLKFSDSLVVRCINKLKNSAVPDSMRPDVIKLFFGSSDSVSPLSEMIRAVGRTRVFPDGGKTAKQVFVWKGVGERKKLSNCRTITIANIVHKLAESCIKSSAGGYWAEAGFPRPHWGHFFGAPESLYIWVCTVEKYYRRGERPITLLTDVSRAFDRVHHELYTEKTV